MTEQSWLGNDDIDPKYLRGVVMRAERWLPPDCDPLFDPDFPWWMRNHDDCDCPEFAKHPPDCAVTPIYAAVYADVGLPAPGGWPLGSTYIEIRPEFDPFPDFYPRWLLNEGSWKLPDEDSFDPEPLPPWAIRQEKPENDD